MSQLLCLFLLLYAQPVLAIPPPEVLLLAGGQIIYPGLLLAGVLIVLCRYLWIQSGAYVFWRMHLRSLFSLMVLLAFFSGYWVFSQLTFNKNLRPVSWETLQIWQTSDSKPVLLDLRTEQNFQKIHAQGALNFPNGKGLSEFLLKNQQKKIIFYCENGLRSSNLLFMDFDKKYLEKFIQNNLVFYLPGGLQAMAKNTNFPVILGAPMRDPEEKDARLKSLLLLCSFLFLIFLFMRLKELKYALNGRTSSAFIWFKLTAGILSTFFILFHDLNNLPIPFDAYLYAVVPGYQGHFLYFFSIFGFFGLSVFYGFYYSGKTRMIFLKSKILELFFTEKYIRLMPAMTGIKAFFITSIIVYLLYEGIASVSLIFLAALFLTLPFLIDTLIIICVLACRKTLTPPLFFLRRLGFATASAALSHVKIETRGKALGAIQISINNQKFSAGLFSTPTSHQTELYCKITRQLLYVFKQDMELKLHPDGRVMALRLLNNAFAAHALNRQTLLNHHHECPGDVTIPRFCSSRFQGLFEPPSPLMLSILNQRWSKKGGCIKALHHFTFWIKSRPMTTMQLTALSNQIYQDEAIEKAVFQVGTLHQFIRRHMLSLAFPLALKSLSEDFYTIILPSIQMRLIKLEQDLSKSLSSRRLKSIIRRAVTRLYKDSARWQCHAGLLHEYAFNKLQNKSKDINYFIHPSIQELPVHYRLSATQTVPEPDVFFTTEAIRTEIRHLQLKEWNLIGLLLEKLRLQLGLQESLIYLNTGDLLHLPRNIQKLQDCIRHRKSVWHAQNDWHFPEEFSLEDTEKFEVTPKKDLLVQAIRVSGNQSKLSGTLVLFHKKLDLPHLSGDSILVAENVLPEEIIKCRHLRAVILKKGSYLSHTSILAREMNLPLIARFDISRLKNGERVLIHSGIQIKILGSQTIEWEFLEKSQGTGNKAERLALLKQHGFPVPEALVIKSASVDQISADDYQNSLHNIKPVFECLFDGKNSLILRSSTDVEDTKQHSHAGLFYSEADIDSPEKLLSAVLKAVQNIPEMDLYSTHTDIKLNLILQNYIKGEFGGVLFTRSSQAHHMQVEIARGGTEGITTGGHMLTSLLIDARGQHCEAKGKADVLTQEQYKTLYELGLALEHMFGCPQDIEWVLSQQRFYIIQSRDIIVHPGIGLYPYNF